MRPPRSLVPALLLAATLSASGTASATPAAGLSATFDSCTDRARGLKDQQACITQEKARQDKRLNDVYAQLGRRLTAASRAKLQVAERAWLQSHARDGEFVTALLGAPATVNPEGGVMEAQRLAARATVLEQYLEQVR